MGSGPSKQDVKLIQAQTGMSTKEIKQSFKDFKKEAGGDKLKLDKFTKLIKEMNTNAGNDVNKTGGQVTMNVSVAGKTTNAGYF